MKNKIRLRNFAVYCRNDRERRVALKFFQLASKQRVMNYFGTYVGMLNPMWGGKASTVPRAVCAASTYCPNETIIDFQEMDRLANTRSRKAALAAARKVS